MKRLLLTFSLFVLCISTAFAQSASYVAPINKIGGAIGEGIGKSLIRRGFAANDPRIAKTVGSVSARVATVAGTMGGGNWIKLAGRAVPYAAVALTVYEGVKWYYNLDGTVTVTVVTSAPANLGQGLSIGAAYIADNFVCSGIHSTPEGAVLEALMCSFNGSSVSSVSSITFTQQNATRWAVGTKGYVNGVEKSLQGLTVIYVTQVTSDFACPTGSHGKNGVCVPDSWSPSWFAPPAAAPTTVSAQAAYDALPQVAKNAAMSPELAAELANRFWQDAAAQPGYEGFPFSSAAPVTASDLTPYASSHPSDWPSTSKLNDAVPTTNVVTYPESTPDEYANPAASEVAVCGASPLPPCQVQVDDSSIPDAPKRTDAALLTDKIDQLDTDYTARFGQLKDHDTGVAWSSLFPDLLFGAPVTTCTPLTIDLSAIHAGSTSLSGVMTFDFCSNPLILMIREFLRWALYVGTVWYVWRRFLTSEVSQEV